MVQTRRPERPPVSTPTCSGSFDDPPSPSTLAAMRDAKLDSEVLTSIVDPEEAPPPGISMAAWRKTKSHSPEDDDLITSTRLRSSIKTTPRASKVMKDAQERRAQQPPKLDGDVPNPFSSPGTTTTGFGLESSVAPSSPLVQQNTNLSFIFPPTSDMVPFAPSRDIWDQIFDSMTSDSGSNGLTFDQMTSGSSSNTLYDHQWLPEPSGPAHP